MGKRSEEGVRRKNQERTNLETTKATAGGRGTCTM